MPKVAKKSHKRVLKKTQTTEVEKYTNRAKKDLKIRFRKAEYAALGILLFIFFFFPIAIFVSGLVAYGAYKYWQHRR